MAGSLGSIDMEYSSATYDSIQEMSVRVTVGPPSACGLGKGLHAGRLKEHE